MPFLMPSDCNQLVGLRQTEPWDCCVTESAWLLQAPLTFKPLQRWAEPFQSVWKSAGAVHVMYTTWLPGDTPNKEQPIDHAAKYSCLIPIWHSVGEWEPNSVLRSRSMPTIQHIVINLCKSLYQYSDATDNNVQTLTEQEAHQPVNERQKTSDSTSSICDVLSGVLALVYFH